MLHQLCILCRAHKAGVRVSARVQGRGECDEGGKGMMRTKTDINRTGGCVEPSQYKDPI